APPRSSPRSRRSERRLASSAFRSKARARRKNNNHQIKSPAVKPGFLIFESSVDDLPGRGGRELRDHAFERLVGLLDEVGVETGNLLRLRDEGFVRGLRVFGLHFKRLVKRLHARELFDKGPGVLIRLLAVVAIRGCDGLKALELLLAVTLNVFNLEHHGILFPD